VEGKLVRGRKKKKESDRKKKSRAPGKKTGFTLDSSNPKKGKNRGGSVEKKVKARTLSRKAC